MSTLATCALQSGSNGNAIYVETAGVRLLFDAGISGRRARLRLEKHHRNIRAVDALILSHAHGDHTRAAGIFQRLFHFPIFATPATHHAIRPLLGKHPTLCHFAPGDTLTFGDVTVYTLPTPHDAADSVAFIVEFAGKRLGIFTDLGHPFPALRDALARVDAAYLESNYDPHLLDTGPYPPELRARIRGLGGHLSNHEAAELLGATRGRHAWISLAHLSEMNNRPDLALATHRAALGPDFPLHVASRYDVSALLTL